MLSRPRYRRREYVLYLHHLSLFMPPSLPDENNFKIIVFKKIKSRLLCCITDIVLSAGVSEEAVNELRKKKQLHRIFSAFIFLLLQQKS